MADGMQGKRILVVGASSGIGLASARELAGSGATVALAARRADKLRAEAEQLPGSIAVPVDVSDAASCTRLVDRVAVELGELDGLLYTAGLSGFSHIDQADSENWRRHFDINVLGATLILGRVLDHLAPDAFVTIVSSRVTLGPYWGMSPYAATKAALDESIRFWRLEHPTRRVCRITMGNVAGTDIAEDFDAEVMAGAIPRWDGIRLEVMDVGAVGATISGLFDLAFRQPGIDIRELHLEARAEED